MNLPEDTKVTITIDEVIRLLANCTAIYVDGESLCFPQVMEEAQGGDVFLSFETQYGEEVFRVEDNRDVLVDAMGQLVLINDVEQKADIMLLNASPVSIGRREPAARIDEED